jgi:hypothetical protein
MLSQIMGRHYQTVATLLGAMQNAMTPPQVKEYFAQVVVASNLLMKKILKNFGHEEVDRLVPDPMKQKPGGQDGNQPAPDSQPQSDANLVGGPGGPRIQ